MSTTEPIFFDDSLPTFMKIIAEQLGSDALERGLFVRDTSGRLRFVSPDQAPTGQDRPRIEALIVSELGAYARTDAVVSFRDEPGTQRLLKDPGIVPIHEASFDVRLLDRRIVGSAWLESPRQEVAGPPYIVFASLKGGVGRSSALAVTASDFSRRNKNVLVVDLDLEAPGIGDMLLDDERLPRFGTIDFLVENGLSGIPDRCLSDFVGTSPLTTPGGGRVDVLPAFGKRTVDHPSNTLSKLSRAIIEDINSEGASVPMTEQIEVMIRRFTERETYDLVLIDSRAGLSEIAAPAIVGLGASVLLFGTAQRQTIRGYSALFAGLKLLAERDRAAGGRAEWRLLLKAVHAKAGLDEAASARFRDDLYDLFADNLYDADDVQETSPDTLSFNIDDKASPHWPLLIPFTQNLVDFDPVRAPGQLTATFYEQIYRPFLDGIDLIISSRDSTGPEEAA